MATQTAVQAISLDRVYGWVFPQKFATLNGVYQVTSITTYDDALTNNVDFVKTLYTPAGLTSDDYTADATSYRGSLVYQLQAPNDTTGTSIYVPSTLITVPPDPTVSRYIPIYLSAPLGIFKDPSEYAFILQEIDDLIASVTGKTGTCRFMGRPDLAEWKTDTEYSAMATARAAAVKQVSPMSAQLQSALTLIDSLKAQLNAKDEIIRTSKATITTNTTAANTQAASGGS